MFPFGALTVSVRKIRAALVGTEHREDNHFLERMYYLLGWLVGDAIKHLSSERRLTIGLYLQLSRKYPENVQLGEYVMDSLRMLGVRCVRGRDGEPRKKVPNGFYFWYSSCLAVVGWLFTACVGLDWNQRTTKHPVRMEWLLGVPECFRVWFLRGLADSDGGVHFRQRWVDIATSPNTAFVRKLFHSIGLRTRARVHRGYGYVSISCKDAARIQIFNPDMMTYRRKALERLANAVVYRGSWPEWLNKRVVELIKLKIGSREISEIVLNEDNIFVRPRTVEKKRKLVDGAISTA